MLLWVNGKHIRGRQIPEFVCLFLCPCVCQCHTCWPSCQADCPVSGGLKVWFCVLEHKFLKCIFACGPNVNAYMPLCLTPEHCRCLLFPGVTFIMLNYFIATVGSVKDGHNKCLPFAALLVTWHWTRRFCIVWTSHLIQQPYSWPSDEAWPVWFI